MFVLAAYAENKAKQTLEDDKRMGLLAAKLEQLGAQHYVEGYELDNPINARAMAYTQAALTLWAYLEGDSAMQKELVANR